MEDLTGRIFGRWTVECRAPDKVLDSGYHEIMWNCVCECGTRKIVRGKSLKYGDSTSCGCLQKEGIRERASKHHGFGTRLYNIWNSMRQRCLNPNHHAFHNYGGRGITICSAWNDYDNFRDWALRTGYKEDAARGECTLDRIDVNGCYAPENCRWSSMTEQSNNRRDSIVLTYNGESKPLTELARDNGVKYCTAWKRYKKGLPIDQILIK